MPIRILIVEDDVAFQKMLELRLLAWKPDCEISSASRISQARTLLDNESIVFDIVILDQHLPDGLGNELFSHPRLQLSCVLAVSADETPNLPGKAVIAGAQHFLGKRQVSAPLFIPLVEALIERKQFEVELRAAELQKNKMQTIRVLLKTLRHEINNPLGAVLGATFLVRSSGNLDEEQNKALRLIEESGNRIKHVLQQLCDTAELEQVVKGREEVFQIPGDPRWDTGPTEDSEKKESEEPTS